MARPRADGQPSRPTQKQKLTDPYVRGLKPPMEDRWYMVWDLKVPGLAVCVYPTGLKSWKVVYMFARKQRWLTLGKVGVMDADKARELSATVLLKVATGIDVQAEKQAARGNGTFDELATRYVEEYARKKNKSWEQADWLIRTNVLPKWGKLRATDITRSDAKLLLSKISSASTGKQTLASASAVFSWAIKEEICGVKINPCQKIDTEETGSRERVLSDSEIPLLWAAFDDAGYLQSMALKLVLLTGQRSGEVRHLRTEHIKDNWWQLPGKPVAELNWPGTKNAKNHRVWLPKPALEILAEVGGEGQVFKGVRLDEPMRKISAKLELVEPVKSHDLRRTFGTLVTGMGFGRQAMDRILNHTDRGVGSVYDRHGYGDEDRRIMEAVADKIMQLVEGKAPASNVVAGKFGR